MVLYDIGRNVIFSTETDGNPGALLFVEDDGYIVIKDMEDESGTSSSGTPMSGSIESSIVLSAYSDRFNKRTKKKIIESRS